MIEDRYRSYMRGKRGHIVVDTGLSKKAKCDTCKFFVPLFVAAAWSEKYKEDMEPLGRCQRNPPIYVADDEHAPRLAVPAFPIVNDTSFCGAYEMDVPYVEWLNSDDEGPSDD